jgi:hypothetical protein
MQMLYRIISDGFRLQQNVANRARIGQHIPLKGLSWKVPGQMT